MPRKILACSLSALSRYPESLRYCIMLCARNFYSHLMHLQPLSAAAQMMLTRRPPAPTDEQIPVAPSFSTVVEIQWPGTPRAVQWRGLFPAQNKGCHMNGKANMSHLTPLDVFDNLQSFSGCPPTHGNMILRRRRLKQQTHYHRQRKYYRNDASKHELSSVTVIRDYFFWC